MLQQTLGQSVLTPVYGPLGLAGSAWLVISEDKRDGSEPSGEYRTTRNRSLEGCGVELEVW